MITAHSLSQRSLRGLPQGGPRNFIRLRVVLGSNRQKRLQSVGF